MLELQINSFLPRLKKDQREHAKLHLLTIIFALSKFILEYTKLFEEANNVLRRFPEAYAKAKEWSEIISRLD